MKATELMFNPPLSELEAVVHRLVSSIVEAAQGLPRVRKHCVGLGLHFTLLIHAGRACTVP